jgi:ubiquinone/menaquinone biosynthesis C-methylase UbiE
MPAESSPQRDDWTHLDGPEAAAVAIAKMEALGRSAAEVAARKRCLDLLDIHAGHAVMDAGAGTGLTAIEMARRVGPGGRVVALDASAQMAAFARAASGAAGASGIVDCHTGRAEALPFPDGAFDRSFCRWVLLHTEAPDRVVREMLRVTRPGGRIMCVEADWETVTVHPGERTLTRRILNFSSDRHIEGWSGRRLAPLLRACGASEVCVEPIVIVDQGREGPEWLGFLHQRAEMAVGQGVASPGGGIGLARGDRAGRGRGRLLLQRDAVRGLGNSGSELIAVVAEVNLGSSCPDAPRVCPRRM